MTVKSCYFVGSSKRDISDMPDDVKDGFGLALFLAQTGGEADNAKALKGFGGRGVLEVIENHEGDTFRAVYTVRFSTGIYVLHAFHKKSKSGIATPKHELKLVISRLKEAETLHQHYIKEGKTNG
jgi:phage-related protein